MCIRDSTEKGRHKFQEEIEITHALFKDFVKTHRPQLDLDQVATGEYWYGTKALDCRLADELRTSDDYLLQASATADLYEVTYTAVSYTHLDVYKRQVNQRHGCVKIRPGFAGEANDEI